MDLGTDVKILSGDFEKSATGDLQLISGLLNLKEAIYRRIITSKGEIVHRPNYGVGINRFRNRPCTPANRQELSNEIRLNIYSEERIETIHQISCTWDSSGTVEIEIKLTAYGTVVQFEYKVVKL